MNKSIKVNFRNIETREFPSDTTLYEISQSFKRYFNYEIMGAKIDNEIEGLDEPLTKKCTIDFFDRSDVTGNTIYSHSVQFLMIVAAKQVLGSDCEIKIEHSLDKGVYCEILNTQLDKIILNKIKNKMDEIVKQNLTFTHMNVKRTDAIKYFKKVKQPDKVKVLKYISNSYVTLYRLDETYDYFFSPLAYSTKDISDYRLTYIKNNGFILSYPSIYTPECTLDYNHKPMIFNTFLEYTNWGKTIGIENAAELNEYVSTGKYNDIIRLSEAYYESQLSKISAEIYEKKDMIKMVLLAGPSSSGKTTSAKKLSIYLQSKGFKTHMISTDDYFHERKDTPYDENGEPDFESLRAIDLDLFNKQMAKLLDGEKVLLPEFNFITGKKEYKKKWLQIGSRDILIIEGLHCLNEELTMSVERKEKFKIFIGPFTQLNVDNHNRIHTSDTRRLRRIIRDNKYRGYNAADTLKQWAKIREGEEKYIYPFQSDTDAILNSAFVYEIGVLKTYAEPLLFSVPETDPVYPEALRLINFLRNFLPIPSDDIPKDALLREFIGGSGFN